jgi:hypothetical protein
VKGEYQSSLIALSIEIYLNELMEMSVLQANAKFQVVNSDIDMPKPHREPGEREQVLISLTFKEIR